MLGDNQLLLVADNIVFNERKEWVGQLILRLLCFISITLVSVSLFLPSSLNKNPDFVTHTKNLHWLDLIREHICLPVPMILKKT